MSPLREGAQDAFMGAEDYCYQNDEDQWAYRSIPTIIPSKALHRGPVADVIGILSQRSSAESTHDDNPTHQKSPTLGTSRCSTSRARHGSKATSSPDKGVKCEKCGEEYSHRYMLNKHMAKHDLPYACPRKTCTETKASKKEIDRHVWAAHCKWANEKDYRPRLDSACPVCGAEFTRADNMKQHLNQGKCKGQSRLS